jgi:acyl-CoA dehydrogenase
VRIAETWDTLGMRATGSNDVLLEGVFVPEAAVSVRRPAGLWHPAFHLVAKTAFPLIYSVYLGIAESARDLVLAGLGAQQRSDPLVQLGVGEMENALAAARLALEDMVEVGATLPPAPETTNRVSIGRSLVAEAAIRCTERAMELAGGRSFYRRTGLERRFRDIQAARFHPLRPKEQLLYAGRMALGMPIDG